MRTFIAIEIPENIRAKLLHIGETLQRSVLIDGNFVSKDGMHLTLRFLGNISTEDIAKIKEILSTINMKKFDAFVQNLGVFPNEDFAKVLWVGVHGKEIEDLQRSVLNELDKYGFKEKEEVRPFKSHITIARVKSIKNKDLFKQKFKSLDFKEPLGFSVKEFHLFKSELRSDGPVYKKLASFPLK